MAPERRPDPDSLLAEVQREEARARRGRLRIFFGMCAGVGKTYAMLEAARAVRTGGTDVVVGYVEPHGRRETERLLEGLDRLPTLPVLYRGIVRQEFDLDAALARRAAVLVVDELAHSNLVEGEPRPRHAKRWQDVEELLDAGLDVWTTVNVQHLESLNDVVAGITGVRQQETVPDRLFDEADEIELIDLPPDDLLARLRAGHVYVAEQVATAAEQFFRKPNLIALRELALRRTADRVDASARAYGLLDAAARPWLARDRLLVAVGPDAQAAQLVRAGKRLADALDARWTVVYVETPALLRLTEAERDRRIDVLRLAESLGAETVTLDGPSAAEALIEYAQTRNATRILVGAPKRRGWRAWLRPSTATELARRAPGMDVIVVAESADVAATERPRPVTGPLPARAEFRWRRYGWALATTLACSAVAFLMYPYLEPTNLVMVYLFGAAVAGLRLGRGPAILVALANVAAFDFFFVTPRFNFAVTDVQYLLTFVVMLLVALTIATLMANVRQQTRVAGARERRTALLYAMSRELAATRGLAAMATAAVGHVAEVFASRAVVLLPDAAGRLHYPAGPAPEAAFRGADLSVAQWVADHGREAGLGTDTLPAARAIYLPLVGTRATLGVLGVLPTNPRRVTLPEQRHLLETFASQVALAIERARLAESAETAHVAAETESLRNTLLASISHDLRTPLAAIAGAGSTLARHGEALPPDTRRELAASVERTAREMSELVSNVLDLMRFESGQIELRRGPQGVEDLVGVALHRLEETLSSHAVDVRLPASLPLVDVDATLAAQVFVNLLQNVAHHTPPGTTATLTARPEDGWLRLILEDDGPGLPPGDVSRLFEKFQRGRGEGSVPGAGLGLAICRAIVRAHGGSITAGRGATGGARFEFTLPVAGAVEQPA